MRRSRRSQSPAKTLGWYGAFLRRHAVVLSGGMAIGLAVAVGFVVASPMIFRSAVQIVVSPLPSAIGENTRQQVSVDSDAQLATSTRVLQAAAEQIGYPGGSIALAGNVTVRALPSSKVLEIAVDDPNAETAFDATEAIADHFLRVRGAAAQSRLDEQRAALDLQLEEITTRLSAVRQALPDEGPTERQLVGEERELVASLSEIQEQIAGLIAQEADPGFVSEPPIVDQIGGRPAAARVIASGILLGLMAGALLGFFLDGVVSLQAEHRQRGNPTFAPKRATGARPEWGRP